MTQFPDQRDAYSRIDETFEAPVRPSSNGLGIAGTSLFVTCAEPVSTASIRCAGPIRERVLRHP